MEELLAAAAEAMNVPASMVERSAEARAKATGGSVEEILRAWAGGGEAPVSPPATSSEPEPASEPAAAEPTPAPKPAAPSSPQEAVGEAEVIALAAQKMNMPESMIERSAKARAKASGSTYEAVLAGWAGVEESQIAAEPAAAAGQEAPEPAAVPDSESTEAAPTPAASADPAPAAPAADEGELLAAAAEKMGMPESMVKRSAGARAKAQGTSVIEVLAEWAGVEAPAGGAAAEPTATPEPQPSSAEAPSAPVTPSAPDVEVIGSSEDDEAVPSSAPLVEPDPYESEEEAVAAGALPRWLAALFVFVPAFAIAYALFLPNGPNCGDAGSLAVDPVTGVAVNCDLSEFGSTVADYFAIGSDTYQGIGCVACHGAGGGGVASFPAFTGGELLSTFPEGECAAQIEWIALGTANWPDPTYGANDKPVGGSGAVMPGFASTLSAEEIAAVALYERVAFGGQDLEAALVDCGLGAGGEDETAAAGMDG